MKENLPIAAKYVSSIVDALFFTYKEALSTYTESYLINTSRTLGFTVLGQFSALIAQHAESQLEIVLGFLHQEVREKTLSHFRVRKELVKKAAYVPGSLISSISNQQRKIIMDSVEQGGSVGSIARRFRESIGLTWPQMNAVDNYREALQNLSMSALERDLRDHRYDATVLRAIEDGTPLSQDYIDRAVERYRQRLLKYRAETIARTESMRAMNMAEYEALREALHNGELDPTIRRFWVTANDERVRANHIVIPSMNALGVGVNEHFDTPLGPLLYPQDPEGEPGNVINCRCMVSYSGESTNYSMTPDIYSLLG